MDWRSLPHRPGENSLSPVKIFVFSESFARYRYKLTSVKSSEKDRFQNAFTVCNVALDSVVSAMFEKSACHHSLPGIPFL